MSRRQGCVAIVLALAVMGGVLPAARAEEQRIRLVAPWEGRVRIYVVGPQQALVLGVFAGRLSADKEASALHGAQLLCPGAIDADYAANTLRGDGRCIITTGSQDRLFARWTCAGVPDQGCAGRFVLTGGTGAYQGVTGDGELALRMTISRMTNLDQLESDYEVKGVATWPTLEYRTP